MSYCLNPECQRPQNPKNVEHCRRCGSTLLLKARYRPTKLIGQGGFGRTFLAIDEDKPSRPHCVVKQFLPTVQELQHVKKAASLFRQEAMRLEELGHHPQIPALLAQFSQEQRHYLVQEFVDGKNLAELLYEHGPWTEAQVREVLASLLPVLNFVHSHSVIHRDVKPANIICVAGQGSSQGPQTDQPDWAELQQALAVEAAQHYRDVVKSSSRFSELLYLRFSQPSRSWSIADYGRWLQLAAYFAKYPSFNVGQRQYVITEASRLIDELRRRYEVKSGHTIEGRLALVDFGAAKSATGSALIKTGTTIGSPEYLAPEQARGRAVFASDLYSLGVTCVHLLTNTPPGELFDSHEDAWVWQRYLPHPISDKLGYILDKLLEPGLNRRYQSAMEVMTDLGLLPFALTESETYSQPAVTASLPARGVAMTEPTLAIPLPSAPMAIVPAVPPAPEEVQLPAKRQAAKGQGKRQSAWQCVHQMTNTSKVLAIALSPTESVLASSSGTLIRLWDHLGQPLRNLTGHVDLIHSLVISPDGQLLISGSADKSIRLWDLQTGQRMGSLHRHTDTVLSLALSPNGQLLASGSLYDPIQLWDLSRHQEQGSLSGHSSRVDALAFSPDGTLLASGSGDATITLWNLTSDAAPQWLKGHSQAIASLAFSPDGKTLASGSWDGTVKLWSTRTCREKRSLSVAPARINAVAFSPDGKALITGGDQLILWNCRTGKELARLSDQAGMISAVSISPTGNLLVSSRWDGIIQLWRN